MNHKFPVWQMTAMIFIISFMYSGISGVHAQVLHKYGDKSIYLGDCNDIKILDDILGVWEDGKGTSIRIYLTENPCHCPTGKRDPAYKWLPACNDGYCNATHRLAADVEFYNHVWKKITENIPTLYKETTVRNYCEIEKESANEMYGVFTFGSNIYGTSERSCSNRDRSDISYWTLETREWAEGGNFYDNIIVFYTYCDDNDNRQDCGSDGTYYYKREIRFDYTNKYIYNWSGLCFHEKPTPLVRVSKEGLPKDKDKDKEPEYAVKVTATPRDVKPDGKSAIEISAVLYEYIPGDNTSSKPLQGKRIQFSVDQQHGIVPGTLSATSSVTDANGKARVMFTAPSGELLGKAGQLVNTAIVKVRAENYNVEDLAYINFLPSRGKVFVEPSNGIISDHGIVPPDKRFPARIRAYFEGDNLEPLTGVQVTAQIRGSQTQGLLRSTEGKEAGTLNLVTDRTGYVEFYYFFASGRIPESSITEIVEIRTKEMILPLQAKITTGLNLVIDKVENRYEGKGSINTGEQIPLMIRVKDAWNPEVDLGEIINFWGSGPGTGDSHLDLQLEIVNLSSIPDYFLDHMRQERFPEAPFKEKIQVRSFKDKKEYNILWVPESSLRPYGYPRVIPAASGNHYYEARISLVDQDGNSVFSSGHPGAKAYFNLQTGMAADALYIFFVQNPLKPQTREAELFSFALNLLGMGTLISVVDAMDAINRGDSDALYNILFSEVKGFFIDQAKDRSPDIKKAMDSYARLSMAETIAKEVGSNMNGAVAAMEKQLYGRLARNADNGTEQVIILKGNGSQKLFVTESEEGEEEGVNLFKGKINIKISGIDDKTKETAGKIMKPAASKGKEVTAYENKLYLEPETGITSLKKGNVSYYIVPAGMEVGYENGVEIKKF